MSRASGIPSRASFRIARGLKWVMALGAPALAAGHAWIAWGIVQDRLAGRGWENAWLFALMLATIAGLALLFIGGLALILRARLTLGEEGLEVRGLFRTRSIPWKDVEGYRVVNQQLNAYVAGDKWPLNLAHFENRALLYAWIQSRVSDLNAAELAREEREIRDDHALGWTQDEKAATLRRMRRVLRTVNWIAYVAAAVGGADVLFLGLAGVQLAAACVLIAAPLVLVLLALGYPNQVRLDYKEGSVYAEGLTGIMAASLAIGLISLLDTHTLLGERFYQWALPLGGAFAGLWLYAERARIRALKPSLHGVLAVLSVLFLSGFWAGGSVYQVNKHADDSVPVWSTTRVTDLRTSHEKTGTSYRVRVAPWTASTEPVELHVSHETYDSLRVGMNVEVSVRRGALEIPWVEEVRPQALPSRPRPGTSQ